VSYLKDIAVFVRVVELNGFAAAGRSLGLTAPSVSKQIARLEAEIGVPLLHRTTHNLFLTDAGRAFFERCVKGLAELQEARVSALSFSEDLRGRLRVHTTLAVGQALIAPAILAFMTENPAISIELDMGSMPVNPMELQVDVAIRTRGPRESSPGHVSMGRRILGRVRHVLVAAPAYLTSHRSGPGKLARVEDIPTGDCLLYHTFSTFSGTWLFHDGSKEISLKIDAPRFSSNNWLVVRQAALDGLGLARLPEFTVREDIAAGRLVSLFDDQVRSDLQVQAVFPKTQRLPAKTRLLLDFLSQHLAAPEAKGAKSMEGQAEVAAMASSAAKPARRTRTA
jgi:DNA-binding transcriptional LysR family regulator